MKVSALYYSWLSLNSGSQNEKTVISPSFLLFSASVLHSNRFMHYSMHGFLVRGQFMHSKIRKSSRNQIKAIKTDVKDTRILH